MGATHFFELEAEECGDEHNNGASPGFYSRADRIRNARDTGALPHSASCLVGDMKIAGFHETKKEG
jgi:hypothetical protein